MKFCIWHPELKPALALLDPELTLGLAPNLTAWTGFDAMVHAIEAYCVPEFHPMCDGIAIEGLRLVSNWLPTAVMESEKQGHFVMRVHPSIPSRITLKRKLKLKRPTCRWVIQCHFGLQQYLE